MSDYFIYYASTNIVGAIIFGIMLIHDCLGVDRQEKQIKYDQALIAFLMYFISDAIWAGFDSGVFPASRLSALITNFSNFVIIEVLFGDISQRHISLVSKPINMYL